jgi:hypothetical protein
MADAVTDQKPQNQSPDPAGKIRLRFAAEAPIGQTFPSLPIGLFVRTLAVIAMALAGALALARDGAPALNETGTRVLIANVDHETKLVMRRTTALADRLPAIIRSETGQSMSASRTFNLARTSDSRTGRLSQLRARDEEAITTASLVSTDSQPIRQTRAVAVAEANGAPPSGTAEQVLSSVNVVDGRTLSQGNFTIKLAGIDLPGPHELCLLLNGMSEPCSKRMATQLELMTRWRQVVCRYQNTASGETTAEPLVGQCRVGNTDLGQRLTQVVRKAPAPHGFQPQLRSASL